ncbi:MAG TPA: hypothetical protein VH370_04550 [Humisphaera sp.]|jgi:hypothetical protein|nr:hypothetical protein [Humisphaera sp.]
MQDPIKGDANLYLHFAPDYSSLRCPDSPGVVVYHVLHRAHGKLTLFATDSVQHNEGI